MSKIMKNYRSILNINCTFCMLLQRFDRTIQLGLKYLEKLY